MSEMTRLSSVTLEGPLTIATAADTKVAVFQHIQPERKVEFDLSLVDEIDCAGLQILILAKRESERLGGQFRLTNPSLAVAQAFQISGFSDFLGNPCFAPQPGRNAP
jgi:anti-anti-sigma factor